MKPYRVACRALDEGHGIWVKQDLQGKPKHAPIQLTSALGGTGTLLGAKQDDSSDSSSNIPSDERPPKGEARLRSHMFQVSCSRELLYPHASMFWVVALPSFHKLYINFRAPKPLALNPTQSYSVLCTSVTGGVGVNTGTIIIGVYMDYWDPLPRSPLSTSK